jgi:hypothetical protein
MKTKMFWLAIALGAVLTTFSSCEKDDPNEVVLNSQIVGSGFSGNIKKQVNEDGTIVLSYDAWIEVIQEKGSVTRSGTVSANGGIRYPVTLFTTLKALDNVIKIDFTQLGEPQINVSYKKGKFLTDGYVAVQDSVLVYGVKYNDFSFEYELTYQVGVFNDGVSLQVIPYHRIENPREGKIEIKDAPSEVIDGIPYAVKFYRHTILVDVGDEEYEIEARLKLIRQIGNAGDVYIVKSEVESQSIAPLSSGEGFISILNVKQTMSDNTVKLIQKKAELGFEAENVVSPLIKARGSASDFKLVGLHFNQEHVYESMQEDGNVRLRHYTYHAVVEFNHFSVVIPFRRMEAWYDDAVLQVDFPSHKFTDVKVKQTDLIYDGTWDGQDQHMLLLTVEAAIGGVPVEGTFMAVVNLY